jgi:hypothetical protein
MKSDPVEAALARLDEIPLHTPAGKSAFVKALGGKSSPVIAKSARLIANAQWSELSSELALAFNRLLPKGAAADKGCTALIAIARALVQLDYDAPEPYLAGARHVQMEGSFGPPVDTAAELREVCAMGLVNSAWPHKLRDLLPLFVDKEWRVRAGVIRAVAVVGNESASLLLRLKMLTGDKDPEVMSECFLGVLAVEGGAAVPMVAGFARSRDPELREAAILALGASRRPDAIEWLKAEFAMTSDTAGRKAILLALSSSRADSALEFLLNLVATGSDAASALAADALSLHTRDENLGRQVETALSTRSGANRPHTA